MGIIKVKQWRIVSVLLIVMFAFLTGCTSDQEEKSANKDRSKSKDNTSEAYPITVVDGTGKDVVIEKEPKTIVSLVPSITETAFALGLGKKVIGVSKYDNYPEEVKDIDKVGAFDINVEKILSLAPDLALVTTSHQTKHGDALELLKKAGITVVVVNEATSFDEVYKSITLIAKTTGTEEKAKEIISEMKQRMAEIKEKAKAVKTKKRVWVEVSPSPDIFTTGKGTFMHEMLEAVQAINVAGEQEGWVKFTEEEIVAFKPEVIITTYGYFVENPRDGVLSRTGWAEVPAIKNKQVLDVDNDMVTRPGPRLIDGIETLGKLIYPEVFGE